MYKTTKPRPDRWLVGIVPCLIFGAAYGLIRGRISDGYWMWQEDPEVVEQREAADREWVDIRARMEAKKADQEYARDLWEANNGPSGEDYTIEIDLSPGDPESIPPSDENDRLGLFRWLAAKDAKKTAENASDSVDKREKGELETEEQDSP